MPVAIFGVSGLRGVVGQDLFAETVATVAAGFGNFLGAGPVALGRDSRPSGELLAAAARAGLSQAGRPVIDLGIVPTPTLLYYVKNHRCAGGIVITASHNPAEWNGMKFVNGQGRFLTPGEAQKFQQMVAAVPVQRTAGQPHRTDNQAAAEHIRAITTSDLFRSVRARVAERRLRVGVDAVNGAAAPAALDLVRALGAEPVPLFCDPDKAGAGFPRGAEPTAENLSELCRLVKEQGLAAGLAFDPDGDRFSCVDETGTPLGEEATVCLACRYVLTRRKGPVVVNLSTTRAVDDVCAEFGVKVARTPVGEAWVVARMQELGAVVGGEGNGGAIVPEVNWTRDGLVAAAIVLATITEKPLADVRRSLPRYQMVKRKVGLTRMEFERRAGQLVAAFPEAAVDRRDGIWLAGPDFLVHARPSNTEPVVRIIAEAKSAAQAAAVARQAHECLIT